ncbi:MAG: hypothetical protein ACKO2G_08305 [Verrucomicrobiales bacterium]
MALANRTKRLVVKEWKANNRPVDSDGNLVVIRAREAGAIDWLMNFLKIDPTCSFLVSADRIEVNFASLSGRISKFVPLAKVSSITCAYYKPLLPAAIGLLNAYIFTLFASFKIRGELDFGVPEVSILLGFFGLATVYYYFNRSLSIRICDDGGEPTEFKFKPSLIEGIAVDEEQARYICELVRLLAQASHNDSD